MEASGFLVGPAVFNTDEGDTVVLAGSIPVRLREQPEDPTAARFEDALRGHLGHAGRVARIAPTDPKT